MPRDNITRSLGLQPDLDRSIMIKYKISSSAIPSILTSAHAACIKHSGTCRSSLSPFSYVTRFSPQADGGPQLFWLDALGALQSVPFGAHGLSSRFVLSLLDDGFREGMSLEEARDLMEACFRELDKRYLVSSVGFCMKVVDRNGCREVQSKGNEGQRDADKLRGGAELSTFRGWWRWRPEISRMMKARP